MSWMYEVKQNIDGIGPVECQIIPDRGKVRILKNLGEHSPDGFQIGYGGSGPADLAYSILLDYIGHKVGLFESLDVFAIVDQVELIYQQFKMDFIVKEKQLLQINSDVIGLWLKRQEADNG